MALRAPRRTTTTIDEALGFVGFFGVVFLVVAAFCELTGRPALGWASSLLACVVAVVLLLRRRRQVLRRTAAVAAASEETRPGAVRIGAPGTAGGTAGRPGQRRKRASAAQVAGRMPGTGRRRDG